LCQAQTPLARSCRPQARNESAIGKGSEGRDSQVDSHQASRPARRTLISFDDDSDSPTLDFSPENATPDSCSRRQRSMEVDAKARRHALESNQAIVKHNPPVLAKAKGNEPRPSPK